MSAARRRRKIARGRSTTWNRRFARHGLRDGTLTAEKSCPTGTFYFLNVSVQTPHVRRLPNLGCRMR